MADGSASSLVTFMSTNPFGPDPASATLTSTVIGTNRPFGGHNTEGFAAHVTVGALVSRTVTAKDPVATFPLRSAALQVTVVVPSGNVDPDAGAQLTGREPSIASLA